MSWRRASEVHTPADRGLTCPAPACRYLEHTGLMWESAEAFGALLVFAEHR